jgi:hypothetical protein
MPSIVKSLILIFCLISCNGAYHAVAAKQQIFVFHTDEFWLSLHHFLYVLGRAQNRERDASRDAVVGAPSDEQRGLSKLNASEREIWRKAVSSYAAGPSKRDIVFDDPLPDVTNTLTRARDAGSLTGFSFDPTISSILESAAAIYRKAWWDQHHSANRKWQKTIQRLVDKHGASVLAFITKAYKTQWPVNGFDVHISAYANWAGAYSTKNNLLVLSSLDLSTQGAYGFETIFHEGMHQWDEQIQDALIEQAKRIGKYFPRALSHSLIFYTAGDAVRRVIPNHVPYAERFGVWERGWGSFKDALDAAWKPYLDGHGTRNEAFAAVITRTAVAAPKQ